MCQKIILTIRVFWHTNKNFVYDVPKGIQKLKPKKLYFIKLKPYLPISCNVVSFRSSLRVFPAENDKNLIPGWFPSGFFVIIQKKIYGTPASLAL